MAFRRLAEAARQHRVERPDDGAAQRQRVAQRVCAGEAQAAAEGQQDDAGKAEQLMCNLARRLESEAPGVSGSILEGLDEMLTVVRLGLPAQLRRACSP